MARNAFSILLWGCVFLLSVTARSPVLLAPRSSKTPAPISIPASQNFEGNDGPWSTFTLQIGTPPQVVTVMVSTAGYQTWAVVPEGCPAPPAEPANCAQLRGGLLKVNESSTWTPNKITVNGTFNLGLEQNLGYTGHGLYGYDTVALGWQGSNGPSLDQQIVAGIATPEFYMGIFGLNPQPTNFTDFNKPVSSYMSNLRAQEKIPSLSWGYTAGNQYRLDKVLGSLTLGGYDASRFEANDATFNFSSRDIRDLTVEISSITYRAGSSEKPLLNQSISAFLDSSIPWLYLPLEVCQQFEEAFGLDYDDAHQVYLVNDTVHERLQADNASITFTLRNPGQTDPQVDIALPYAAFDLVAEYPLAANQTRYFPLARATNDTQYTLGRTFFQEAYVIADYERRNFSVSQCTWNGDSQQRLIPIHSVNSTTTEAGSHGLSGGAIAGVAIGSIVGLAAISLLAFFTYKRFRRQSAGSDIDEKAELDSEEKMNLDGYLGQEIDSKLVLGAEADGKSLPGHKNELTGSEGHHEMVGSNGGHELVGSHGGRELESDQNWSKEMPAREVPAVELP